MGVDWSRPIVAQDPYEYCVEQSREDHMNMYQKRKDSKYEYKREFLRKRSIEAWILKSVWKKKENNWNMNREKKFENQTKLNKQNHENEKNIEKRKELKCKYENELKDFFKNWNMNTKKKFE